MDAAQRNLSARAGNTMEVEFRFRSNGLPVDLTGSEIRLVISGRATLITKTTANGSLKIAPGEGVVTLTLTPTETRSLPTGSNLTRYEIERRIDGEEEPLLSGFLNVSRSLNEDA